MDSLTALWGKVFFPRRVLSKKIMKKGLFVLFVLWGVLEGMAQEPWSLKLELVNPIGKLDGDSYFSLKFYNNTDSSIMLLPKRAMGGNYVLSCISQLKTGEEQLRKLFSLFWVNLPEKVIVPSHGDLEMKLALFIPPNGMEGGVLFFDQAYLSACAKIRLKVERCDYVYLDENMRLSGEAKTSVLYSNWLEIDGEEFYRTFRGGKMSSD